MSETIFGKIARGEIPVALLHEDELCVAFRDVAPQAPVHLLVIPRQGFKDATETPPDILGHVFKVAADLGARECPNGFRLVSNVGADGGQSVFHLHVHVLGGRALEWPPG